MVDGIGKVVEIRENLIITDTGREFEMPMVLEGLTLEEVNEWLAFYVSKLKEGDE